ncbi:hypothetical protein LCGC14_0611030 [marine sediment metagenome]|uniref:Uncharacterized protein n=1 Tax=marine sediment metagenome TaxID=412755 RepID=A0A0F9TTU0_9ZZZZ
MNDKQRSEKLLGVLRRHNEEVYEIVEDWKSSQEMVCKDQEVRIAGFGGGDIVIKFKHDPYYSNEHTHVEIWTRGYKIGSFHITEKKFEFFRDDKSFECKIY